MRHSLDIGGVCGVDSLAPSSDSRGGAGDFYQTVNEYTIKVYYRAPGSRYDRLLGVTTIFSGK